MVPPCPEDVIRCLKLDEQSYQFLHRPHQELTLSTDSWVFRIVQSWQVKSGIITWVCTNSCTAPDASVTAKAVCAYLTG